MTPTFTTKEGQVIDFVARGYVSKEIATQLGIDEESVEDRIRRALRRLGARTRSQLVAMYLRKSVPRRKDAPSLYLFTEEG